MNKSKKNMAAAVGVAGVIALSATSLSAAPVMSSTATLKDATPSDVVQVRSRSGRTLAAAGIGFAAGALIGAAASSHAYAYSDPYWYGHSYAYAPAPVFASSVCHWNDPWCNGHFGATFAAPAPAFIEPHVYAAPAPVVRRRTRVVVDPGPTYIAPGPGIFAGPYPVFHRQLLLDANPGLGTIHGASGVD
jgi:hypothetical protein